MNNIQELLEEYNSLRQQVYETELRIINYQQELKDLINFDKKDNNQTEQKNEEKEIQIDQLNKITLALNDSNTREIQNILYDEEKDAIVIQLKEQNHIIELELKNEELHRIKMQQIGKRDTIIIDQDHPNFDVPMLKLVDQPFSSIIIPFLEKIK